MPENSRSKRDVNETIGLLEKKGPDIRNSTMQGVGASQADLVESRHEGRKLPQYIAALSVTLGALATGTILGWSSPVGVKLTNENTTDYTFVVSETERDWIASLINLGAAAICFPIGLIMDSFGRKRTMLFLVIPFSIGWLCIIYATNASVLMFGRFITGVSGGAFCVTAPTYTSEIAQDSIRGTLGTYFQLMITVGILFSNLVGSYTSIFFFNVLCALIPIIFTLIFFFMPESPNYLVIHGEMEEAKQSLVKLRGRNYDVDAELNTLVEKAMESKEHPVSFRSAITKKTAVKAIVICFALMLFQQLSGINAVIFNTTAIFESSGATLDKSVSAIIIGVIQVIATFASTLVVDRLGRRILLLLSSVVMCVCLTALGVFFFLKDSQESNPSIVDNAWWIPLEMISWLPLASLSVYFVAFSLGLGPIPWMMAGELCLIDIKAFVAAAAGTLNWLLSFTVTKNFNLLNSCIGRGQVFWLFGFIMLLGFLFVFLFVPETKGKSADEIQVMLGATPQTVEANEKK